MVAMGVWFAFVLVLSFVAASQLNSRSIDHINYWLPAGDGKHVAM